VSDTTAREHVGLVWGAEIPTIPGRSTDEIVAGLAEGGLAAVVVGGVDLNDLANPAHAQEAFHRAGFIVSLEMRHSSVTKYADVVLPIASSAEKAGRYVNWEGRRRPFDLTITSTGMMSDHRALHALADELDVDLGLANVEAVRAEIDRLGTATDRPAAPTVAPGTAPQPNVDAPILATWAELIDAGRLQDGDDNLAGTAKPVVARLSAATAAAAGVSDGAVLRLTAAQSNGDGGAVLFTAQIDDLPDGVVWAPTNAAGHGLRAAIAADHGAKVAIAAASTANGGAAQ
jgi:NADH-quinone oxidoreductase subunit G